MQSGQTFTPQNDVDVLFLLNFTSAQRTALLTSSHTRALLYTPTNEHFGIGPVEGMACGVPVLACTSGGPTESVVDGQTGFLRDAEPAAWAAALQHILALSDEERKAFASRAQERARSLFGREALAKGVEAALYSVVGLRPLPAKNAHELLLVVGVLCTMTALMCVAVVLAWIYQP